MKRPSLADQLKLAKAPQGSRLEKLIQENQDFDVLHTEELEDSFSLPLWLRVFWRKQHPELQHPTKNPGAGYPEVLGQIYKRMVANPDYAWGTNPGELPPTDPPSVGK